MCSSTGVALIAESAVRRASFLSEVVKSCRISLSRLFELNPSRPNVPHGGGAPFAKTRTRPRQGGSWKYELEGFVKSLGSSSQKLVRTRHVSTCRILLWKVRLEQKKHVPNGGFSCSPAGSHTISRLGYYFCFKHCLRGLVSVVLKFG